MTRFTLIIVTVLFLSACSTSLVVTGNYPKPITHRIPLNAGLFFDTTFSNYKYFEQQGSVSLEMSMGAAQIQLFEQVSAGLFNSSQRISNPSHQVSSNIDMILVPKVAQVQVATPKQTKLKVYEVWIKYNLQVFSGTGTPIADWIMTAYGKTPSRTMTSDSDALNLASVAALRDAGARLVTGFDKVPDIRSWLEQHNGVPAENNVVRSEASLRE
jgi:O-antigen/teichoic acid export membrane protein